MSAPAVTHAERLARIETLLEQAVKQRAEDRASMRKMIDEMASDIKAIKVEVEADKAELAKLKNQGVGVLIGVGLLGGSIGAGFAEFIGGWVK